MAKKNEQQAVDPTKVSGPLGEQDSTLDTDYDGDGTAVGTVMEVPEHEQGFDPNEDADPAATAAPEPQGPAE